MTKEKEHVGSHEQVHSTEHHASQEHLIRVEKVKKLRELGIEPWPESKPVTSTTKDVVDQFQDDQEKEHTIAGRIIALRGHGKTIFGKLQDREGSVQVYF